MSVLKKRNGGSKRIYGRAKPHPSMQSVVWRELGSASIMDKSWKRELLPLRPRDFLGPAARPRHQAATEYARQRQGNRNIVMVFVAQLSG